jgi:hypothetical protein
MQAVRDLHNSVGIIISDGKRFESREEEKETKALLDARYQALIKSCEKAFK